MNRFEITEHTGYSTSWIFLAVLFVAGIIVWFTFSAVAALIIAAVGLVLTAFFRLKGKKRIGGQLELNEKGMIFYEEDQARCIAFNEIKYVKFTKRLGVGQFFVIETTVGNKRTLNPEEYERGDQLRERLIRSFDMHNCKIIS